MTIGSSVSARAESKDLAPKLMPRTAHVWRINLAITPDNECDLSESEQNKANQFTFSRDRVRYIASHVAVRNILGQYLGLPPQSIKFHTGSFGKPLLERHHELSFNLSHSENVALLAISDAKQIGIDIEKVRSDSAIGELWQRIFSDAELHSLNALENGGSQHAFYTGWTRKEAYLKALGTGFTLDPRSVEVGINRFSHRMSALGLSDARFIEVASINIAPGFATAIAMADGISSLHLYDYEMHVTNLSKHRFTVALGTATFESRLRG